MPARASCRWTRASPAGCASAKTRGFWSPTSARGAPPGPAKHGEGLRDLQEALARYIEPMPEEDDEKDDGLNESDEEASKRPLLLAIVGRPNVAKATLPH